MAISKSTPPASVEAVMDSPKLNTVRAQVDGIKIALDELERRLAQIYSIAYAGGLMLGDDHSSEKDLFGVIEDLSSDRKLHHHIVDRVNELKASLAA